MEQNVDLIPSSESVMQMLARSVKKLGLLVLGFLMDAAVGSGYKFINRLATGLIKLVGIMLPANCCPVKGLNSGSSNSEKLPARVSAVGTAVRVGNGKLFLCPR